MFSYQNISKQNPLSSKEDFVRIKEKILGKKYDLSLVFVDPKTAKKLNKDYRKKTYVPNVLSFPVDKNTGEIFICLEKSKAEAKDFEMTKTLYIKYLAIHGMLHLKGLDHGKKMEEEEERLLKVFG
ncbi:rRNA maturation RNase YbeY [Candidatus Nomurabacteria bacterium]|nr:rRNA maturation RNase YbeY [Candidatus Nomurabacteria bacterium]